MRDGDSTMPPPRMEQSPMSLRGKKPRDQDFDNMSYDDTKKQPGFKTKKQAVVPKKKTTTNPPGETERAAHPTSRPRPSTVHSTAPSRKAPKTISKEIVGKVRFQIRDVRALHTVHMEKALHQLSNLQHLIESLGQAEDFKLQRIEE